METPDIVLKSWLGGWEPGQAVPEDRLKLWFHGDGSALSSARSELEALHRKAVDGQLTDWEKDPRGCLALILLLDPIPRALFAGTPEAYAHDRAALRLTLRGIDRALDRQLSVVERSFFYFPLVHAEDPQVQKKSLNYFTSLAQEATEELWDFIDEALDHAIRHNEVIERFGRFPQRNSALGRESTAEESEYLSEPGVSL